MCMLPAQYHVWLAIFTPLIADKFLVRTKEHIKTAGSLILVFTAMLDKEEEGAEYTGRCLEEGRVILQCLQDFPKALTK